MTIDFTKSSKEIVVGVINDTQSTTVLADEVNIAVVGNDATAACTLQITGVSGKPYKGSKSVSFTRTQLSSLGVGISSLTGSNVTAGYLISGVNAIYGINLSADEVTIDGTSYASGANINMAGKASFTLAAKSSLLWVGSVVVGFRPTA